MIQRNTPKPGSHQTVTRALWKRLCVSSLLLVAAYPAASAARLIEPGYEYDGSTLWPWDVKWSPGARHPRYPHIASETKEGYWVADPGYRFLKEKDLTATWVPGTRHPAYAHISAHQNEGSWLADPGYRFKVQGSLTAQWTEHLAHPSIANIYSANKPDYWVAAPGYVFASAGKEYYAAVFPTDSVVRWKPGSVHPHCSHVVAAKDPGYWHAISGYRLVSRDSLDVVAIPRESGEAAAEIATGIVVALIADYLSTPDKDDGAVAVVGREFAKEVRNQAAAEALKGIGKAVSDPAVIRCDQSKRRRVPD